MTRVEMEAKVGGKESDQADGNHLSISCSSDWDCFEQEEEKKKEKTNSQLCLWRVGPLATGSIG